jgi:hypothetical protein
MNEVNVPN